MRVVKGIIIGVGAILPGISGGVLCVIFGIYEPMLAFLAHPVREFKKRIAFFIPVIIGWAIGLLGLARVVDLLFRVSPTPAVWLFIGLIAGTLPALFKSAGKEGRNKFSWIAFAVSFALTLFWMLSLSTGTELSITPNLGWWLICGVLWGISLVVPGLSSSAFMIFFGLYQPMAAGIADFSLPILIPIIVGIILSVLLLARIVEHLLKNHYSVMFHIIFGVVIASTIAIIPSSANPSAIDISIYAACFFSGLVGALFMDKISRKIE